MEKSLALTLASPASSVELPRFWNTMAHPVVEAVLRFFDQLPDHHVSVTPELINAAQGVTLEACEAINESRRARGERAVRCGDEPSYERLMGVEWDGGS